MNKRNEEEDVNSCICELLWLIDLANDIRISDKMRREINNVVAFIQQNKMRLLTDESKNFIDILNQKCQDLGYMRYQNDYGTHPKSD